MIVGIDEVGRGCWAGPVCVAAAVLDPKRPVAGLADSKTLSAPRRAQLNDAIVARTASLGIGWASARYIDTHGIVGALRKAAADAIGQIAAPYDEIIVDGTINLLDDRAVTLLKKADTLIPAVSAASIVAKVARDRYMQQLDSRFPGYGLAAHVGYGTAAHRRALDVLGPSLVHRMSFAPMKDTAVAAARLTYHSSGALAETRAAKWLETEGYRLVDRNWKTRWCEIDIIAEKAGVITFFEVKYRKTAAAGAGLAYITPAKMQRMRFAAELWLTRQRGETPPCKLGAIELGGPDFAVSRFIEQL